MTGLLSLVTRFCKKLFNGPDLNVVGIPVEEFTQRRREEQARYRDGLAQRIAADLNGLFRNKDFENLNFRVLPPRSLRPSDKKAGLTFMFDVPEHMDPPLDQDISSLHRMQVRSTSGTKSLAAHQSVSPGKVNLHDPETWVIPVYNGRDQRLDSLLFVHRGGVIIAVNGYEQKNLASALIQSREFHPVAEIHPLHPQNTKVSIDDGGRQLCGKYKSHLRALALCPSAAKMQESPSQIVVPVGLFPPAHVPPKGLEHFRGSTGGTPVQPVSSDKNPKTHAPENPSHTAPGQPG